MIKNASDTSNPTEHGGTTNLIVVHSHSSTVQRQISADPLMTPSTRDTEEPTRLKLVWKAYIQTPVRLTEKDAFPVGLPECSEGEKQRLEIRSFMPDTVRAYRMMLPTLADNLNTKRDLDESRLSHAFSVTQAFQLKKPKIARKPQRFLKSSPKRGVVVELNRSDHFETFLRQFDQRLLSHNQISFQTSIGSAESEGQFSDGNEQVSERSFNEFIQRRSGSVSTRGTGLSIFSKTLTKIQTMFPISPYRSTIQRRMSNLNSLKNQRLIAAHTDMVEGCLTRMQSYDASENDSLVSARRRENSRRISRHILHKGKASHSSLSLVPRVVDTDAIIPGLVVLETKIRDYDMHETINTENLEDIRKVYRQALLKEPTLKTLLTHNRLDALPKPLRTAVRVGKIYRHDNFDNKFKPDNKPVNTDDMFCPVKGEPAETALSDTENLWLEAKVFTAGLYQLWLSSVRVTKPVTDMPDAEFYSELRHLSHSLRQSLSCPTSTRRFEMLSVLKTCAMTPRLLPTLWATVDDWLENLLAGLYSPDRTVREETCYILAYLFTKKELVEGVRQHTLVDLGYDCTMAVLHAIEINPTTFIHYYCLLALMVEGCPMFSVLNAIIDNGVQSSSQLVKHMWPRLIYYALKFWNPKHFSKDRMTLRILNECIEKAFLKGISRKNAKMAQIQLSKRFKVITKPTTIWLDEWAIFGQ